MCGDVPKVSGQEEDPIRQTNTSSLSSCLTKTKLKDFFSGQDFERTQNSDEEKSHLTKTLLLPSPVVQAENYQLAILHRELTFHKRWCFDVTFTVKTCPPREARQEIWKIRFNFDRSDKVHGASLTIQKLINHSQLLLIFDQPNQGKLITKV